MNKFQKWYQYEIGSMDAYFLKEITREGWDAAKREILAILKENELGRIQEYPGIVINPKAIKEIEEL